MRATDPEVDKRPINVPGERLNVLSSLKQTEYTMVYIGILAVGRKV
jgi:hypothetical protein